MYIGKVNILRAAEESRITVALQNTRVYAQRYNFAAICILPVLDARPELGEKSGAAVVRCSICEDWS